MYIALSCSKYDHTLSAFEVNTGKTHPLAASRGTHVAKRSTGVDPLTDSSEELWFGTIDVGTPAVSYTIGERLSRCVVKTPATHCPSVSCPFLF